MTNILSRLMLEDYGELPETNIPTEVVDGVLVVTPMATPRHQRVAPDSSLPITRP